MSRFFLLRFSYLCLLLGSHIPAIYKLSECRHASGVRRRLIPRGYYHKSLFSSATNRTGWTTDNRNFTFRVATVQDSGVAFRVHQAYFLAWFSFPSFWGSRIRLSIPSNLHSSTTRCPTYLLSRILFQASSCFFAFANNSVVSPSINMASITSFCSMLLTTF